MELHNFSPLYTFVQEYVPVWLVIGALGMASTVVWLFHWPAQKVKLQPMRASPFHPDRVPHNIDTIVIGSGSGGSATANLLAQAGQRVLVLEQHPDRTGGCTHSFREHGCEWDTGTFVRVYVCSYVGCAHTRRKTQTGAWYLITVTSLLNGRTPLH